MQDGSVLRLVDLSFFTQDNVQAGLIREPDHFRRLKRFPVDFRARIRIELPSVQAVRMMFLQIAVVVRRETGQAAFLQNPLPFRQAVLPVPIPVQEAESLGPDQHRVKGTVRERKALPVVVVKRNGISFSGGQLLHPDYHFF